MLLSSFLKDSTVESLSLNVIRSCCAVEQGGQSGREGGTATVDLADAPR